MKRLIIAALALCASNVASASTWGTPVTITGYYVYASGGAYFKTSSNQNPDGCSSSLYLSIDTSQPFFKEIYASIIAAYAQGSTVSVLYDGCVGPYPKVGSVATPAMWP